MLASLALLCSLGACKKDSEKTDPSEKPSTIALTGISLNVKEISLAPGEDLSLTVTFTPENASNKKILWSSSTPSVATVADGKVTAVAEGTATITAKSEDGGFTATCEVTVSKILVESISLPYSSLNLNVGDKWPVEPTFTPANATDKSLSLVSFNKDVATIETVEGEEEVYCINAVGAGSTVVAVYALGGSGVVKVEFDLTVIDPASIPDGAVDLGLSVYWASSNLCESGLCAFPADYGDYYAWGETETKTVYDWSNYKWCNGTNETLTKYNNDDNLGTVDNNSVLDLEDDVAHVKLGDKWRMPTAEEVEELVATKGSANYQWEWKDIGGHNGWEVTCLSKGTSIFLPAAGFAFSETDVRYANEQGYYWSSTVHTQPQSDARHLFFDDRVFVTSASRETGSTVRPVYAYAD